MICLNCGGETRVIDSRNSENPANSIVRRRKCISCGSRFTTKETIVSTFKKAQPKKSKEDVDLENFIDSLLD